MIVTIAVVDAETSDLKREDGAEVIEWARTDLEFDTETKAVTITPPQASLYGASAPLKPENIAIHHITDEMIAGLPLCDENDLRQLIAGANFVAAHNFGMEGQWLTPEILGDAWPICTMKAARQAWRGGSTYSNQGLRYARRLPVDVDLAFPPHRAAPDTHVTAHILADLLRTETVKDLVRWTQMPAHYETCPFGKHKGQAWRDIPASYLQWMSREVDMDPDFKAAANKELQERQYRG